MARCAPRRGCLKQQPRNSHRLSPSFPFPARITEHGLDRLRDACPGCDRQWLLVRFRWSSLDRKPVPKNASRCSGAAPWARIAGTEVACRTRALKRAFAARRTLTYARTPRDKLVRAVAREIDGPGQAD
jgi:hypothetical protein